VPSLFVHVEQGHASNGIASKFAHLQLDAPSAFNLAPGGWRFTVGNRIGESGGRPEDANRHLQNAPLASEMWPMPAGPRELAAAVVS
jgi:hypothetical protein